MNELFDPKGLPLDALRELRRVWSENIERQRSELSRIERAIRALENPMTPSIFSGDDLVTLLTSGGNIRGLGGWIIKALTHYGHVMTASDLTDAMYSYSWPLPPHQFKRRVVVAASALNMEEGEKRTVVASGLKGGREVYWALPDWMHEGHLLLNRYPVIREPQYTMAYGRDVAQKITEAPEGASNDVAKEDGRLK